eukprot:TRINITY_DN10720_c0_g1_i1.p1 TRINITY_DN10720_c0_g1~~TRINITY_DN10720_c0_g1_i1.p1  ORF type:complete len:370 (+),score=44.08 TRINITY_DN10720_c0_g1_i1:56-1111(+)
MGASQGTPACRGCGRMFSICRRAHRCGGCLERFCAECTERRPHREQQQQRPNRSKSGHLCTRCFTASFNSFYGRAGRSTQTRVDWELCPTCRCLIASALLPGHKRLCGAQRSGDSTCPRCSQAISAALYDGHREVCRGPDRSAAAPPISEPAQRRGSGVWSKCPRCDLLLHASLFAGHVETCAIRQAMSGAEPVGRRDSVVSVPDEEQCVICFEARRHYAFIPCGHWCCCSSCAKQMSDCPMCRKEVRGFMPVDPKEKVGVCPVCKLHVHPTFFDSHREVCRLQLKARRKEAEEAQAVAEDAPKCVTCSTAGRDVAFVPCGHLLCCAECAGRCQTCPACCAPASSVLPVWT